MSDWLVKVTRLVRWLFSMPEIQISLSHYRHCYRCYFVSEKNLIGRCLSKLTRKRLHCRVFWEFRTSTNVQDSIAITSDNMDDWSFLFTAVLWTQTAVAQIYSFPSTNALTHALTLILSLHILCQLQFFVSLLSSLTS